MIDYTKFIQEISFGNFIFNIKFLYGINEEDIIYKSEKTPLIILKSHTKTKMQKDLQSFFLRCMKCIDLWNLEELKIVVPQKMQSILSFI